MTTLLPLAIFPGGLPGWAEMLVILLIVFLFFGNKLPRIARNLGRSMVEFKKGIKGVEGDEGSDALPAGDTPERIEDASKSPEDASTR